MTLARTSFVNSSLNIVGICLVVLKKTTLASSFISEMKLLALSVLYFVVASAIAAKNFVINLEAKDFDSVIKDNNYFVVFFVDNE